MAAPKYTGKLSNAKVLIIGGTSGIGFGLAEALVELGISSLYISSSRKEKVDSTIARLKGSKTNVVGLACNLGDEKTLEANIEQLFASIPEKLDHIVFTAGDALAFKALSDVDLSFMKQSGMVRFYAPYFVAKYGGPRLNPGPASSITLTGGAVGEKPAPQWSITASYLAGLHGMTRGLALELKPIRVNLVCPGTVDTELWETSLGSKEVAKQALGAMAANTATGAVGSVVDVTETYLYLMKDKNVTATAIRTDSGLFIL